LSQQTRFSFEDPSFPVAVRSFRSVVLHHLRRYPSWRFWRGGFWFSELRFDQRFLSAYGPFFLASFFAPFPHEDPFIRHWLRPLDGDRLLGTFPRPAATLFGRHFIRSAPRGQNRPRYERTPIIITVFVYLCIRECHFFGSRLLSHFLSAARLRRTISSRLRLALLAPPKTPPPTSPRLPNCFLD